MDGKENFNTEVKAVYLVEVGESRISAVLSGYGFHEGILICSDIRLKTLLNCL